MKAVAGRARVIDSSDPRVRAESFAPGEDETPHRVVDLEGRWPPDVYSLGHVALPFSPLDSLYGGPDAPPGAGRGRAG